MCRRAGYLYTTRYILTNTVEPLYNGHFVTSLKGLSGESLKRGSTVWPQNVLRNHLFEPLD